VKRDANNLFRRKNIMCNSKYLYRVAIIFSLTLYGCSSPYYGYSKAEWDALSINERIAIKEEYDAILATKNNQRSNEVIQERTESIIDFGSSRQSLYKKHTSR
jgi:TRAP-type C4-dicarboxylate transport system substrate-binding protein